MKHFNLSEFDSPDSPGSGKNMNPKFLEMLDEAREIAGVIFDINSGYRTKKHNQVVKGKADSAHTRGYAADISAFYPALKYQIIHALMKVGFNRIGIADSFIHVDNDPSKPVNVIWTY